MSTLTSSSSKPRSRITTLFLLFAIYVLSFGPVHALYASHRLQGSIPSMLVTFYKPVNWLYENTPLGKPMIAYDGWWKRTLQRS
jgi:hypothetical protein